MKTFSVETLGCKVNQYESRQIESLLELLGLNQVLARDRPDLAIVNTCCVTASASAKSRHCIRKTRRLSPGSVVIVTGCLPRVQTDELNKPGENIHLIKDRNSLVPVISKIVGGKPTGRTTLPQLMSFKRHTRAFLKVQDGCDGCCSYCIIPKARPLVHSRPIKEVLQEAKGLVAAGHKEIVLTGIFLGAFGQKTVRRRNWPDREKNKLAELLDQAAQIPNLRRIRLSSLEPGDVTESLLDVFRSHRNIMPHLHLSLQSGSDSILKKMRRQYAADEFREKVRYIKQRLDNPAITTDIIVGFPGETDEDFEATVRLAKEVGFSRMHIFAFSARKGTAAADFPDTVAAGTIKRRSQMLHRLNGELALQFRRQFIGRTDTVLVEGNNGRLYGRSERYFVVELSGSACRQNDIVKVKLVKNLKDAALGQVTSNGKLPIDNRKLSIDNRKSVRGEDVISLPPV